ncbi:MAG: cell division FtsA domain-containing protein [Eubacteriales bacterium]
MIFDRTTAVMDFGTSKISTLIGKNTNYGVEYYGLGVCEYAGFRNGVWLSPEDLEESIYLSKKDAENQNGKKIKQVNVVIPGEWCLTCFVKAEVLTDDLGGRISQLDIENLINAGMSQVSWPEEYTVINSQPVLYLLDGMNRRVSPIGQFARVVEAYISYTAVDTVFMQDIADILDRLGIGVDRFIPVTASYSQYINNHSSKKSNIIIDTGYYSTDIIICEDEKVIAHRNVPVGGFHITSDLMVFLEKDIYTAELIKRNVAVGMDSLGLNKIMLDGENGKVQFPVDKAQTVVMNRLNEIISTVKGDANRVGVEINNRCGVYITGGGISRMQGARGMCSKMLGENINILKPVRPIQANVQYTSLCVSMDYVLNEDNEEISLKKINKRN